jgi:hypothetical protein
MLVFYFIIQRIDHYHDQYQPLDEVREDKLSFMKIYNTGIFIFIIDY